MTATSPPCHREPPRAPGPHRDAAKQILPRQRLIGRLSASNCHGRSSFAQKSFGCHLQPRIPKSTYHYEVRHSLEYGVIVCRYDDSDLNPSYPPHSLIQQTPLTDALLPCQIQDPVPLCPLSSPASSKPSRERGFLTASYKARTRRNRQDAVRGKPPSQGPSRLLSLWVPMDYSTWLKPNCCTMNKASLRCQRPPPPQASG